MIQLSKQCRVVLDMPPKASASSGTQGLGVCFNGYDKALVIGMSAAGDDSNATFTWSVRVDSDCNVPSDCTFGAFSTDVTTSAIAAYGNSDSVFMAVLDVDLAGHGETAGCIVSRVVPNSGAGSTTSSCAAVIILYSPSGPKENELAAPQAQVTYPIGTEVVCFP